MIRAKRAQLKLSGGMRVVKFLLFFFNFVFLVYNLISLFYFILKIKHFLNKVFGIKLIVVGSILNIQFKDYLDFQG